MRHQGTGMRKRFWKIVLLFVSFGWGFRRLGRKKWSTEDERNTAYRNLYRYQAVRFRETAVELGGLLIKLGQFFSSRVDVLPQEYIEELAKLQDQVPPAEVAAVIRRIEDELEQPLATVFAKFKEAPLAAASLGQVHEAVLHTGEQVAVKVLRPGIEDIVVTDLRAIKVVLKLVQRYTDWLRNIDIDAIYTEFRETVEEELDYLLEGQHAERFRDNFADNELVKVPEVFWQYTTRRVIVLEFIEGKKVSDYAGVEALGWARQDLAQLIIETYLQQVLTDGFFHADPHPGNLMVTGDGKLVYLDFGMMGEVSQTLKSAVGDAVVAIITRNTPELVEAFERMGFLRPNIDKEALTRVFEAFLARYFDDENISGNIVNTLTDDMRELFYNEPFQLPAKVTFLGRALVTVVGITSGLDPGINFLEVIRPYIDEMMPQATGFDLIKEQGKKILGQVITLPEKVNRVIGRLESGKLKVRTAHEELEELFIRQSLLTNRIVLALLLGCGIISATMLYVNDFIQWGNVTLGFLLIVGVSLVMNLWSGRKKTRFARIQQGHQQMRNARPIGFKRPKIHGQRG